MGSHQSTSRHLPGNVVQRCPSGKVGVGHPFAVHWSVECDSEERERERERFWKMRGIDGNRSTHGKIQATNECSGRPLDLPCARLLVSE
jgi:hypothetical protein